MATPIISQSYLHSILYYDPLTGDFTWQVNKRGRFARVGRKAGRPDKDGYLHICIDGHEYKSHRLAWFYVHGVWPAQAIDHIDLDKANNRIANLREATLSENRGNVPISRHNTSGLKGVGYDAKRKKFTSFITRCGKSYNLGRYDTAEEAAAAYAAAANEYFGKFARTA